MKDIKEKPTGRVLKSNVTGKIPKAALKKAWTEAKEKSRTKLRKSTAAQGESDYTTAQDTGAVLTDTSYSSIKQNTDFTVQQGRKIARKQIQKYRERRAAEQVETTHAHAAGECGVSPKQAECGTLPDSAQRPRRGADLPRQRAKEKAITAKTAPRDIRGVTQGQRQLRTAANETVRSITTQAQNADPYPSSAACYPESHQQHPQDGCGGALGNTAFPCRPAQSCRGHCCRD